jgi:glycosyl hydrolase family 39 (putative alpha-L-iduronidase)
VGPRWVVAFVSALVAGVATTLYLVHRPDESPVGAPRGVEQRIGRVGGGAPKSWPAWGFTHTQYSAVEGEPGATGVARDAISRRPLVQAQAIMGWGVDNPKPTPYDLDFRSLDHRIDLIRQTHGIPVITLCCAPDWMKGGARGQTDWSRIELAPEPRFFGEYAKLAAEVARRYPDVRYYVVWNEFKGFFDETRNRWDTERYTELYNKVYAALKAVNPDIKVGGPYIPMNSYSPDWRGPSSPVRGAWGSVDRRSLKAVEYWLEHKKGADFIAVDGFTASEDRGLVPDEFTALDKFAAVTTWLRSRAGGLPVWWAEWYVAPEDTVWSEPRRTAVLTAAMIEFARSGAATALYWSPQRSAPGGGCTGCLWAVDTGRPTAVLDMLQKFARWFPIGTELVRVSATPASSVRVLAQPERLVIVNTTAQPVDATVDGRRLRLDGYQVRWLDRQRDRGLADPGGRQSRQD